MKLKDSNGTGKLCSHWKVFTTHRSFHEVKDTNGPWQLCSQLVFSRFKRYEWDHEIVLTLGGVHGSFHKIKDTNRTGILCSH